ncbi:hypothetical protein E2C01_031440 [Portunus trituberculatus]|uniref:Uncharacterized protein n=1 Tax=Portunus trituberculatus TaxID=210409 RepID=A0A5B7EWU3_PORTR|nr:hypothetical protein [Portunus trituberculatus]
MASLDSECKIRMLPSQGGATSTTPPLRFASCPRHYQIRNIRVDLQLSCNLPPIVIDGRRPGPSHFRRLGSDAFADVRFLRPRQHETACICTHVS